MTYHHVPGPVVSDIYAEHLRVSEFRQAFLNLGKRRDQSVHVTEHPVEAEEERMTYHHVPGHPVADIYEEYLTTRQAINNAVIQGNCIRRPKHFSSSLVPVTEHPGEVSEGWLGCSDSESDSPGGWAR